MARILFTVWPFTGCVHPQIAVARKLHQSGHEIGFYTGHAFRTCIEAQRFAFFPFDELNEEVIQHFVFSDEAMGRNWDKPWKLSSQLRGLWVDTVPQQVTDIERIMARWSPDAIVTDPAIWAPLLVLAERDAVPVAILSYACGCMLPGADAPPNGLGLPLARHWWTSAFNQIRQAATDLVLRDMRRAASVLRESYGLSPLRGPVIGLAGKLPLYLVPSCPEFDYNRTDLPPGVQYVGPLQWYPAEEPQPWLDNIRQDRPWIHVTEGTLHVRDPFLLRAAAIGLADLPVEVIITAGDDRTLSDMNLPSIPSNVHFAKWVSHATLLPRTRLMITTAGGGTVMAGMQAGVPLIVVPTEWDKAENAQRVVEAGAGIRISPSRCTPRRLRRAVERVLNDSSYLNAAQRMSRLLADRGGADRAASLVAAMTHARQRSVSVEVVT